MFPHRHARPPRSVSYHVSRQEMISCRLVQMICSQPSIAMQGHPPDPLTSDCEGRQATDSSPYPCGLHAQRLPFPRTADPKIHVLLNFETQSHDGSPCCSCSNALPSLLPHQEGLLASTNIQTRGNVTKGTMEHRGGRTKIGALRIDAAKVVCKLCTRRSELEAIMPGIQYSWPVTSPSASIPLPRSSDQNRS